MKKQLVSIAIGLSLALSAGLVSADGVGPYYATPSWDQQLPSTSRFVVLSNWGGQAALDRETGLVWQLNLVTTSNNLANASEDCSFSATGGRGGWRLPTSQELMRTLISDSSANLITGSPFPFIGKGFQLLWTTNRSFDGYQWVAVILASGESRQVRLGRSDAGVELAGAWCVQSPAAGMAIQ